MFNKQNIQFTKSETLLTSNENLSRKNTLVIHACGKLNESTIYPRPIWLKLLIHIRKIIYFEIRIFSTRVASDLIRILFYCNHEYKSFARQKLCRGCFTRQKRISQTTILATE